MYTKPFVILSEEGDVEEGDVEEGDVAAYIFVKMIIIFSVLMY